MGMFEAAVAGCMHDANAAGATGRLSRTCTSAWVGFGS